MRFLNLSCWKTEMDDSGSSWSTGSLTEGSNITQDPLLPGKPPSSQISGKDHALEMASSHVPGPRITYQKPWELIGSKKIPSHDSFLQYPLLPNGYLIPNICPSRLSENKDRLWQDSCPFPRYGHRRNAPPVSISFLRTQMLHHTQPFVSL